MDMVLSRQWIASAFLVNEGPRGAVSDHARQRGVSRQRIYRESHWVHTRVHAPQWQCQQRLLLDHVAALEGRVAKLEAEREQTRRRAVVLDAERQAEFASVGQAIGVSLPELRQLLQVFLGQETPSVAKLGRMTKAAAAKAGAILAVLDEVAKPLVEVAAADEIYTKAPVLMAVEPESLCWVKGQKVESVRGQAWCDVFAELPNLRMVLRDAGTGLSHGVDLANDKRADAARANAQCANAECANADGKQTANERGSPLLAQQDHFHSLREGARGLGRAERAAKAAFVKAEKMQKELEQRRRNGQLLSGVATQVKAQWRRAEKAFDVWSERSRLWNQVKDALRLVTPEGELNTPARAEQAVRQALATLPDADFGKSKRQLQEPETYTYLHEVQRQLAALPVPAEVREAAVRIECLRRRPELLQGESSQACALRALLLVSTVVLAKAQEVGVEAAQSVRSIFRSAWRASSLVECLNSVLRMQQARHRNLSQGLLDLKRLYWNSHSFRTGRRRGQSPYEHLGVQLPDGVTWWNLLKWPPEQLRQELSARKPAA